MTVPSADASLTSKFDARRNNRKHLRFRSSLRVAPILVALTCACRPGLVEPTVTPAPAPAPKPEPTKPDRKELIVVGALSLPGNQQLEFNATLRPEATTNSWAGTVSIPAQGLHDAPLSSIEIAGNRAAFPLASVGATWTYVDSGSSPTCEFVQSGQSIPCTVIGESEEQISAHADSVSRPQTPQPPFPYDTEEVVLQRGDINLVGTITKPRSETPAPAVVLLTGSGAQDRDETILGHKPFHVLASSLAVL